MKLLQSKIAVIGLIIVIGVKGYGQQGITISGTLGDSLTHDPIRFATVTLLRQQTNSPVKRIQTDSTGHFALVDVPGG
ncbi:MAG TPA: carboxypeptidase-like regulatory domain-containing protein, partial [Puia sp.]|nr:carboxypeptidase-like regulatory domain-containing protein [Puia sp.]